MISTIHVIKPEHHSREIAGKNLTEIADDAFSNSSSLMFLHLPENKLTAIGDKAFSNLGLLNILDLSENKLTVIGGKAFSNLGLLNILDLSKNNLTSISHHMFSDLRKLKYLYLSRNNLMAISDKAFSNLNSLYSLHLKNNMLTCVNIDWFQNLTELEVIILSFNPFEELTWVDIGNNKTLIFSWINYNLNQRNRDELNIYLPSKVTSITSTLPTNDSHSRLFLRDIMGKFAFMCNGTKSLQTHRNNPARLNIDMLCNTEAELPSCATAIDPVTTPSSPSSHFTTARTNILTTTPTLQSRSTSTPNTIRQTLQFSYRSTPNTIRRTSQSSSISTAYTKQWRSWKNVISTTLAIVVTLMVLTMY